MDEIRGRARRAMRKQRIKNIAIALSVTVVIIVCVAMAVSSIVNARGNKSVWDTNYTFKKAIIKTADGNLEVDVKEWNEWEDIQTVQVITTTGDVYYTHFTNVILKTK